MRMFAIRNEYGQRYELNNVKTGFLNEPSGLGFAMEYNYVKVGSIFKKNFLRDTQRIITGTIVYDTLTPYAAEADFLEYIRKSKELVMEYTTPAGTWLIDVDLIDYQKSEVITGTLSIPVQFISKSLWYKADEYVISLLPVAESEKKYDYQYDYTYNDYTEGEILVYNDGTVEAALAVDFYGPISNPVLVVYQNEIELKRLEVNGYAQSGEHILYSSRDDDLYIKKSDGTNLVSGLNLENTNFFKLPIGNSTIKVTSDSPLVQPIVFTIYRYYRQV